MTTKIDLKAVEKKAFKSTFQDGIWDIYLGILLLNFSIFPWLVETFISPLLVILIAVPITIIALLGFIYGKKFITVPRIGVIKFGQTRKSKLKKVTVIMSISAIGVTLLIVFTKYLGIIAGIPLPVLIFSLICVIVFCLGAYFLNFELLYLYGILYALPIPVGFIMKKSLFSISAILFTVSTPGIVMMIIGVVTLIHFLRTYPKPTEEMSYVS